MSSRSALVLALLLLLAPMAAASGPTLDRPSWTAGDQWTYATNTTILPGLNLTGTLTSTMQGTRPVVLGNTTVDAYDVVLQGAGTAGGTVTTSNGTFPVGGNWILTGEQRYEPVGLQLVYNLLDLQVNGTAGGVYPFTVRVQNTTSFQIVSDDWRYPLAAGASGRLAVRYNYTQDSYSPLIPHLHQAGTGEWNLTFSVAAPSAVVTPAGTFQAFPVSETWPDGSVERSFEGAQVGNNVRTESYTADGNLTAVSTLTSYRYQVLETPTFLGLTSLGWGLVGAGSVAAAVAVLVLRRAARKKTQRPPTGPSGPGLT